MAIMKEKDVTLYKYMSIKYAVDVLTKQHLYVSDGKNFNDPFEEVVIDKKTQKEEIVKNLYILCLTNSYRKKLMWSHYADSHKGICITVKVPKTQIYPVCYSSKRVFKDSNLDQIIKASKYGGKSNIQPDFSILTNDQKIVLIKDHKWNYEKEYRISFTDTSSLEKGEGEKYYFPVKIKNVYLGVNFEANCSEEQKKILTICEDKKIKITHLKKSTTTYSLNT